MTKKNAIKGVGITALAGLLVIGGSLAYFTDKNKAENFISLGHVDITLTEEMQNPLNPEETISYRDPVNVLPGDRISKIPLIHLAEDSLPSYIRATIAIVNPGNVTPPVTIDSIDLDKDNWVCIKDEAADYVWTCYFVGGEREGILNPGDTAELFTEVKIPGEWGVEANASEVEVTVSAEAVQADGFRPVYERNGGAITSVSWVDKDGKEIQTEKFILR